MPKKTDTAGADSGTDKKADLMQPNDVPPLSDSDKEVTLRLKQNAFVHGEFFPAGSEFTYPRADALELLQTTDLYVAK